jgi:hypothetical protein
MLIPPVLPAGINLAIAKWAKGQGPRLLRFGSEAVLAPLVVAPLIPPPSSLNLDAWRTELRNFAEREPLLQWLEDGFPTLSTCAPVTMLARNHGSFFAHQADSLKHLREEVAAGRIIDCGPDLPCWPLRVNPLGSVEKKGTSARRRISDMSFPARESVNDGIDCDQLPALRYASIEDVALFCESIEPRVVAPCSWRKSTWRPLTANSRFGRRIGGSVAILSVVVSIWTRVCLSVYRRPHPILVGLPVRFAG